MAMLSNHLGSSFLGVRGGHHYTWMGKMNHSMDWFKGNPPIFHGQKPWVSGEDLPAFNQSIESLNFTRVAHFPIFC